MIIILLISLLILFILWRYEYKVLRSFRSPLSLLILSNFSIVTTYLLSQHYLSLHEIKVETLIIITVGCILFAIPFLFIYRKKFLKAHATGVINKKNINNDLAYLTKPLVYVAASITLLMLFFILRIGISNLGADEDAASAYAGGGLSGHLFVVLIFITTIIAGQVLSCKHLLLLVPMIFCLVMYQVKIWIFTPLILALFIHRDLRGLRISPIKIMLFSAGIISVFLLAYMPTLDMRDTEIQEYMVRHFLCYFFSGPGGLNEALRMHLPIGEAPFAGLPSFISMPLGIVENVNKNYAELYFVYDNYEWTNVMSLCGELFMFNGPLVGAIYIMIISSISYELFYKRSKSKCYWLYLAYYFWSLGLIFSFYANYYKLLSIWELTSYCFICNYYFRKKYRMEHSCSK